MAGVPPTRVSSTMRPVKVEPIIEVAVKRSPGFMAPRAWSSAMRALTPVPVGERSILPGRIATAERAVRPLRPALQRPGEQAEGDVPPVRQRRVFEAELRVRGLDDGHALLGEVARLIGFQREAERGGIHDHETVAAPGSVDGQGPATGEFEPGVQNPGERREVAQENPFGLAVAALGAHPDEAAGRFQHQFGDRLLHRHDAVSSRTVATQIALEPDMGGLSSGSMMMNPFCASECFGGTSRLTCRNTPPRGSLSRKLRKVPSRAIQSRWSHRFRPAAARHHRR